MQHAAKHTQFAALQHHGLPFAPSSRHLDPAGSENDRLDSKGGTPGTGRPSVVHPVVKRKMHGECMRPATKHCDVNSPLMCLAACAVCQVAALMDAHNVQPASCPNSLQEGFA